MSGAWCEDNAICLLPCDAGTRRGILLHILLDLDIGLDVSIALLSIYLVLAMFFLIGLIRNYGLHIDIEATIDTGIIFSATAWVFLTLIYLVI